MINFEDFEIEEFDDDLIVGDLVIPRYKTVMLTIDSHLIKGNLLRGNINGKYEPEDSASLHYTGYIDEVAYRDDGTKLIRFKGQWPYYESKYWKKVNE